MCEDMLSVLNSPLFRDGSGSGLVIAEVKSLLGPPTGGWYELGLTNLSNPPTPTLPNPPGPAGMSLVL